MSRLNTYQEFVLKFQSPWNLGSLTVKDWTQSFYVSGTITHTAADAETAALALASPTLAFASSATSLIMWTYYDRGATVSTQLKTYTPGTHAGSGSAWAGGGGPVNQLEVACVVHADIGVNKLGKPRYLRKYCHDVPSASGNPNGIASAPGIATTLAPWNTGSGPHAVVPVSPTDGKAGTWVLEPHLFTHQLRKGKKATRSSAGQAIYNQLVNEGMSPEDALKFLLQWGFRVFK